MFAVTVSLKESSRVNELKLELMAYILNGPGRTSHLLNVVEAGVFDARTPEQFRELLKNFVTNRDNEVCSSGAKRLAERFGFELETKMTITLEVELELEPGFDHDTAARDIAYLIEGEEADGFEIESVAIVSYGE